MSLPFDGAISKFFQETAPDAVREAIQDGRKKDILSDSYPYDARIDKDIYEAEIEALQLELVKLQADVKPACRASGGRVQTVGPRGRRVVFSTLCQTFTDRR